MCGYLKTGECERECYGVNAGIIFPLRAVCVEKFSGKREVFVFVFECCKANTEKAS